MSLFICFSFCETYCTLSTYLASVEAGKRNISLNNIKKIADGLNISISELFGNIEKSF